MHEYDKFAGVVSSLHDAALDDARWPATSALIDEACGIHGNGFLIGEGLVNDVRVLSSALHCRGERREDVESEYLEFYHPIDEQVPRVRQLVDGQLAHVSDLYTEEELRTSPTHNEISRRTYHQDALKVRLDIGRGVHFTWSLADPVNGDGWGAGAVALVEGLLPHLRHFVRVRQALAGAEALGALSAVLLDNTKVGIVQLDRRGRILAVNDRALAVLRAGVGLSDRDGLLRADDSADDARLGRLLAGALPVAGVANGGSMRLHRLRESVPVVVHVKPVPVTRPDYGSQRVAALVLLVEPGSRRSIEPALVASTLGLTRAESEVAAWLAEGRSVRDIAQATGRKEVSIHWHLSQIYAKHGLSRQVELVQLVLSIARFA